MGIIIIIIVVVIFDGDGVTLSMINEESNATSGRRFILQQFFKTVS